MSAYLKPLPVIDERSRPYWDAAVRHELCLPRCRSCGHHRAHFENVCPRCLSEDHEWAVLSGRGTVWSFCHFHKAYFQGFTDDLPYDVVLVRLEEGPLLVSNMRGMDPADLRIGLPVEAVFEAVTPEVTLVRFHPSGGEGA